MGIHGERTYFNREASLFSGIALNATLVALSPDATGVFLIGKKKPFFIDPLTYAFSCSPIYVISKETGELKRSIKKLLEEYGDPLVEKRVVTHQHFGNEEIKKGFCKRVLEFQKKFLANSLEEDRKYIEESSVSSGESLETFSKPNFIIAPYLNIDINSWKESTGLNSSFFEISANLKVDTDIYCEIVLDRVLLHKSEIVEYILESYSSLNCKGYLFWISDFPEHSTAIDEIDAIRKIVEKLSAGGREVINLYGGYLSCILSYYGLTSVCHGPGYGEERNIVPVGGGLPVPKYYFPPLHLRMKTDVIEWYLKEAKISSKKFYDEICDCPICKEVIKEDVSNFFRFGERHHSIRADGIPFSYPTERAKYLNTLHFLYARYKEIEDINVKDKQEILNNLEISRNKYIPYFGPDCNHLKIWHDALLD